MPRRPGSGELGGQALKTWGAAHAAGRVAYWVTRGGIFKRVPQAVLRSRARWSEAWRQSAQAYGQGLKRFAVRAGLSAGGAAAVTKSMPYAGIWNSRTGKKRKYPYGYGPLGPVPQAQERGGAAFAPRGSAKPIQVSKRYVSEAKRLRGRRPSLRRKTQLSIPTTIERMQGVKAEDHNSDPDAITPGYFRMPNINTAAVTDTYPIVLMNLTALNNSNFAIRHNFVLTVGQNGGIAWNNLGGPDSQEFDGTTFQSGHFTLERQINGGATNAFSQPYKCTHAAFPWYSLKFQLYGCKKQAVTWDISLVQFAEEWMCPDTDTTLSFDEGLTRDSFWQSMARKQTISSLCTGTVNPRRLMRVLKHKRIVIEPTLTDQNATTADAVDVNWFIRDGRLRRYDRYEFQKFGAADDVSNPGKWTRQLLGTNVENNCVFRQRMYILIRCSDYSETVGGDPDAAAFDSPSFSYCFRRKVMAYGNGGGEA